MRRADSGPRVEDAAAGRPNPDDKPVVIVGGGLCGIASALHLRSPYLLLERAPALGGLARTEERDGFFFDVTGHWLHLRDQGVRELVRGALGDELASVRRKAKVYVGGRFVRYPFQASVHGLPPAMAYDCVLGYVRALLARAARGVAGPEPRSFDEYIHHHFGDGIARHFMIPYNQKLWGVHPREITSGWCQRFVPVPTVEQMIAGATGALSDELGYNASFLYPRRGGIETLTRGLGAGLRPECVRLRAEVEEVDPARRAVRVGGEWIAYRALVSTMPLPELVRRLAGAPDDVVAAAAELRWTSLRYLNVASRGRPVEDYHWVYVPEERLPFYRVGVFSAAMPSMAPPGCSSIYVELAGRAGGVPQGLAQALCEVGALARAEDLLFVEQRAVEHAYVVFDDRHQRALARILPYLERNRIYSRGRYGEWVYSAMEDSIIAGREAAALVDQFGLSAASSSARGPNQRNSRGGR
jgi:protoporphyrinogen oxidase